ncbi:MAG: hypothetical protein V7L27_08870 [Nostoc sp.]|uniref:hypothetical protein n=1 Tax=Nostoc sp. TaxID=1180 RepID=UPI002FF7595F
MAKKDTSIKRNRNNFKRNAGIFISLSATALISLGSPASAAPRLLFHSGFEGSTQVTGQSANRADIVGVDTSVAAPNDWVRDLESDPIGIFMIEYLGGDSSQRLASIVKDPLDQNNHVLSFWLKKPNDTECGGCKGRIQADLYDNAKGKMTEFLYRYKVMYSQDWNKYQKGWVILDEFWNNAFWLSTPYPFRIHTVLLARDHGKLKPVLGAQILDSHGNFQEVWTAQSPENFDIPLGKWIDVEVYYKQGDRNTGRFYSAMTYDGRKTVLFDVHNITYHPQDPNPDGVTEFNPLKLYAGAEAIDDVRNQGGVLQLYFDNFELWTGVDPENAPPKTIGSNTQPVHVRLLLRLIQSLLKGKQL